MDVVTLTERAAQPRLLHSASSGVNAASVLQTTAGRPKKREAKTFRRLPFQASSHFTSLIGFLKEQDVRPRYLRPPCCWSPRPAWERRRWGPGLGSFSGRAAAPPRTARTDRSPCREERKDQLITQWLALAEHAHKRVKRGSAAFWSCYATWDYPSERYGLK